MIKKINAALIALAVALALYIFVIKRDFPLIAYAYLITLFGLYFAKYSKETVLVCAAISFFCALNFMRQSPLSAVLSCILFLLCAAAPYYFLMKTEREKKESFKRNYNMKNKLDKTALLHSKVLLGRKKYEEKFERIMQLYISSREFNKSASPSDIINVVRKAFQNKKGVSGLSVFRWSCGKWICLYCAPPSLNKEWLGHLSSCERLTDVTRTFEMEKLNFLPKTETAIFVPKQYISCIFLLFCIKMIHSLSGE